MVLSQLDQPVVSGESLYQFITQRALAARAAILGPVAMFSFALAIALVRVNPITWPVAMLLVTTGTICVWGLLEKYRIRSQLRVVKPLEWVLVVVGTSAAIAGGLGVCLWILGPRPIN